MSALQHLPVLPVLLPLATAAVLLFIGERHHGRRAALALLATLAQLVVALALLGWVDGRLPHAPAQGIATYALGGWPAPFGIVLVADRLAAVMLTLAAVLGLAALAHSLARWESAGSHFLPLFQLLLMGLNGAFLTGDLFNLFVFFEILLAASYGLALHGSGTARVGASLHYIAINLVAALFFLIAAALFYGLTGTLNMAELAIRAATLDADGMRLFQLAAALLGLTFLVKAGAWPLNFWLPAAYGAAAAPVAAVFALLTKVGVYALLRLGVLLDAVGAPAPFRGNWLFYGGLATLAIGSLAVLAAQRLDRLAGALVIVSSGTLLAAFGFTGTTLTGPALYYLASSVLAIGAFFLIIEMAERQRPIVTDMLAVSAEAFGLTTLPDEDGPGEAHGEPIPAAMAFLGLVFFSCALLLAGLPPLSGFVGKFALFSAALAAVPQAGTGHAALFIAALLLSGLCALIALSRLGMRIFWDNEQASPRLVWREAVPVAALLLVCTGLTLGAGPALDYFDSAAASLHDATRYTEAVLPTSPATDTP